VSGWEAIGGVFQLTRHWSGLLGGDQGEARVGLSPLNCAVSLPSLFSCASSGKLPVRSLSLLDTYRGKSDLQI
jgi:hypothetical protein